MVSKGAASLPALFMIAIAINVGMWLERILIIWNTLSHDYMPSLWRTFHFTFWDWSFLIAPLGFFAFLFLMSSGWCRRYPCSTCASFRIGSGRHERILCSRNFAIPRRYGARSAVSRSAGIGLSTPSRPTRSKGSPSELGIAPSRIRYVMLAGGLVVAAFAFSLQWYSAVIDYPINSGGRPLNSWQVFLLVPFEVGVFAAALCGVVAFLWSCGLPRLHHPLFEVPGFERATQDRFFLLPPPPKESGEAITRSSSCPASRRRGRGDGGPSAMRCRMLFALLPRSCSADATRSMTQQNRYDTYTPAALFPRWHRGAGACRQASWRKAIWTARQAASLRQSMRSFWRADKSATISIARPATAFPVKATAW